MDGLRATPYRSPIAGTANDILGGLLGYMRDPRRTQQMQGLAGLLESTGIPKTVERLAYGEPLTNLQQANVPALRPETAEALLTLLPVPAGANRAAMAAGRAGERMAERVVPQIMERGGMPAGLLEGMATNTISKMFIGPSSKLWDKQAADAAKKMERKFTPEQIWEKTGTFKGKDGKWRQEISDQGLLAKPVDDWSWSSKTENKAKQSTVGPVSEFVQHPKLEQAYDGLIDFGDADRRLMMKVRPDETIAGSYSGDAIETGMTGQGINRGTVVHELQHAIQSREGFAKGGSPDYMPELYREESDRLRAQAKAMLNEAMAQDPLDPSKVLKPGLRSKALQMQKQAQNLDAQANRLDQFGGSFDEYRRLMGEVEAEATRKRLDMSDEERRLRAPWLDYEFPLDQLRVIMKNNNNMVVPRIGGLLGQ